MLVALQYKNFTYKSPSAIQNNASLPANAFSSVGKVVLSYNIRLKPMTLLYLRINQFYTGIGF
jgi:hypothetical protein